MPYEWSKLECDQNGRPFVKGPRVVLEKDGVKKRFTTQETVTQAWSEGWHDVGRPETAEEPGERENKVVKLRADEEMGGFNFTDMGKDELLEFAEEHGASNIDKRWNANRLRGSLLNQFSTANGE